jgi:hypothetical protein
MRPWTYFSYIHGLLLNKKAVGSENLPTAPVFIYYLFSLYGGGQTPLISAFHHQ